MKKIIFFFLLFILNIVSSNAAINPFINYALDLNTSKKFGLLFETNFRTYSNLFNLNLLVFRLGVQYNLTSNHEKTKLQIGLVMLLKTCFLVLILWIKMEIHWGMLLFIFRIILSGNKYKADIKSCQSLT